MSIGLSRRSARIEQAEIRSMSIECERMGGINLAQGVCDTPIPLAVREEAYRGIEDGVNSYTRFDGLAQLREAIAEKHAALMEFGLIRRPTSSSAPGLLGLSTAHVLRCSILGTR